MEATLQNNNQTQVNVNCLKEQNKATPGGTMIDVKRQVSCQCWSMLMDAIDGFMLL